MKLDEAEAAGLVAGQTSTCAWPECATPILFKRQVHVDGPDTMEWVHDVPTHQTVCPGWKPKAKPAD